MKWNKLVITRFSDQDFKRVQDLANKRGLTLTSFIRSVVLAELQKEEQNQRGA